MINTQSAESIAHRVTSVFTAGGVEIVGCVPRTHCLDLTGEVENEEFKTEPT